MKSFKKYWMGLAAVLLLLAAVLTVTAKYLPAKQAYEAEKASLISLNTGLQAQLIENQKYADVRDQLDPAREAMQASRSELYAKFPSEMKEEDQIMYMLYLEDKFGREVHFDFAQAQDVLSLSDGSVLQGMTFSFDYGTTYEGFKKMVKEIATDDRITSVRYATLNYNAEEDRMTGQMVVTLYLLNDGRDYVAPSVTSPPVGKDNPYQK